MLSTKPTADLGVLTEFTIDREVTSGWWRCWIVVQHDPSCDCPPVVRAVCATRLGAQWKRRRLVAEIANIVREDLRHGGIHV